MSSSFFFPTPPIEPIEGSASFYQPLPAPPTNTLGAYNTEETNLNYFQNNKFKFQIHKLPQTKWNIKNVNVPTISIGTILTPSQITPLKSPGIGMNFETLSVEFIVDESLNTYLENFKWLKEVSNALDTGAYAKLKQRNLEPGPNAGPYSDAQLTVLSNQSVPLAYFFFKDCFPTSLSGFRLTNDVGEPEVVTCTVTYDYAFFHVDTDI